MRLSSGSGKGRRVKAPRGSKTRPTQAKVRQALFNLIGPVDGKGFLDLYAGSGGVGLLALSRGAEEVLFVESDHVAFNILRENINRLGFDKQCKIVKGRVPFCLNNFDLLKFNIIFADPPYEKGGCEIVLSWLAKKQFSPGTIVVLQHSKKEECYPIPPEFSLVKRRYYGNTVLTILLYTTAN